MSARRFEEVEIRSASTFRYLERETVHIADFHLFLIREAWDRGMGLEDLADGFVVAFDMVTEEMIAGGLGTRGDWSAVRDSSDGAKARMLERSLQHLLGQEYPELALDAEAGQITYTLHGTRATVALVDLLLIHGAEHLGLTAPETVPNAPLKEKEAMLERVLNHLFGS